MLHQSLCRDVTHAAIRWQHLWSVGNTSDISVRRRHRSCGAPWSSSKTTYTPRSWACRHRFRRSCQTLICYESLSMTAPMLQRHMRQKDTQITIIRRLAEQARHNNTYVGNNTHTTAVAACWSRSRASWQLKLPSLFCRLYQDRAQWLPYARGSAMNVIVA